MSNGWNLETIFNVLNFPKIRSAPDKDSVEIERFTELDYHFALKYFKSLKLKPKTESGIRRRVHLYDYGGKLWLSLAETRPKKEIESKH